MALEYSQAHVPDPVRDLARKDGRFSPEAYRFLFESLETAIHLAGKADETGPDRHVTGRQVLEGLRQNALAMFGPLGAHVWRTWGVRETIDWGHIVFLLVEEGLLNRQESDTIEDFRGGFDFDEAFVAGYTPTLTGLKEDPGGE